MTAMFESYSQNGEDVVLRRALRGVTRGRYVDVGANHPSELSVSMAFYAMGWCGVTVEPDPACAELLRTERPRDYLFEGAAYDVDGAEMTLNVIDGTGLSTLREDLAETHSRSGYETHRVAVTTRTLDRILDDAGWAGKEIHFMSVDTEGSEPQVLDGIDLSVWRPWVLVIEATAPNSSEWTRASWEAGVLEAGYQFCLFDGLSCFYVAQEKADQLGSALAYPACSLDFFITREERVLRAKIEEQSARLEVLTAQYKALGDEAAQWRSAAMGRWALAIGLREECERLNERCGTLEVQAAGLRQEITDLRASTSWSVTRPVRVASTAVRRAYNGR